MKRRALYCIKVIAFVICCGAPVLAQDVAPNLDPQTLQELELIAQEISEQTMSPFCPGRTISACPSGQAWELRKQIMGWLIQGYSPTAVRNQLIAIYGDEVIGAPPRSGFGWVAWITPGVFVVVCLLIVAFLLRRLRAKRVTASPEEISPEMQERIAAELAGRR